MPSNRWPTDPADAVWVDAFTEAADRVAQAVAAIPFADRAIGVGRGRGGDETLVIDRDAENAVVSVLEEMHGKGHRFDLVSEELGGRSFDGDGRTLVVVDPIDGSRNARRGLSEFAVSLAITDGPRLSDVRVGVLRHLGTGETVVAVRGDGVRVDGARHMPPDYLGLLLCLVEGASPRRLGAAVPYLADASRIRSMGSLALAMQYVALGRLDGLAVLRRARVVDVAAATLIIREAGAVIVDEDGEPFDAPIDIDWRGAFAVARDRDDLGSLVKAVRAGMAAGPRG